MAKSGNLEFSTANKYITGRIRWVQTSNGNLYNSSKVTVYLDYKKSSSSTKDTNGGYKGNLYCKGTMDSTAQTHAISLSSKTFYLKCDGKWKNMASYTFTVKHNGSGACSCTLGIKDGHCTNGNSLSDPQTYTKDVTLDAIKLTAPKVAVTIDTVALTSFRVNWSTDTYYNKVEYNINGGAYKVLYSNTTVKGGNFTLSGLSPGTKYTVNVRVTRTDATSLVKINGASTTTVARPSVTVPSLKFELGSSASNLSIKVSGLDKGSVYAKYSFITDSGADYNLFDDSLPQSSSVTSGTINLNLADPDYIDLICQNCINKKTTKINLVIQTTISKNTVYTDNYSGEITIPNSYAPVLPGANLINIDTKTASVLAGRNGVYIPQSLGKIQVQIPENLKGLPNFHATMKNYKIEIYNSNNIFVDGYTFDYVDSGMATYTIGTSDVIDTFTVKVYAVDSRGMSSVSVDKSFTVLQYSPPVVNLSDLTITRRNNFEKELVLHFSATYSNLLIDGVNYNDKFEVTYEGFNITDTVATVSTEPDVKGSITEYLSSEDKGSYTVVTYDDNFYKDGTSEENIITVDPSQIWNFVFTIEDSLHSFKQTATVEIGSPVMAVVDNGMVGINMVPDVEDTSVKLQVNGDMSATKEDGTAVKFLELVEIVENLWQRFYPIGSIYMSVKNTNPSSFLGGTWVSWGAGRVPVGVDAKQTEFDKVEETGGSKTVTLTVDQMPSHTHTQNAHNHPQNVHSHKPASKTYFSEYTGTRSTETIGGISGEGWEISQVTTDGSWGGSQQTAATTATNKAATATNQNTGGGKAHSNLQPYITCYMWKRTA